MSYLADYLMGPRRATAVRTLLADGRRVWSAAEFQRASGLSDGHARRELRALSALGLLHCQRREHAPWEYRVVVEHPAVQALGTLAAS